MTPRFLTLADVSETLNVSMSQVKALVRNGDLPAIKVGGRGAWRVEATMLEDYIQRLYAETRRLTSRSGTEQTPRSPGVTGDEG